MATPTEMREAARCLREAAARAIRDAEELERAADAAEREHRKFGLAEIDGKPCLVPQDGERLTVPADVGRVYNGIDELM